MALQSTGQDIGMNSLEMIPFSEQEYDDYCTGEILVSAVKARADYECTFATPASFASLGPYVQGNVAATMALTEQNVGAPITQQSLEALSSPVISDSDISSAPNAVAVGSAGATSPFTARQIAAANHDPINWPATLTIQAAMQRGLQAKKNRAIERHNRQVAPQVAQQTGLQPMPGWGMPAGSTSGWCGGVSSNPWGKLLLFTGLGLITASLLQQRR